MKILISLQNCFSYNTGIKKFIERYVSKLDKHKIHFIYRENLRRPYMIDGIEVKDIKKTLKKLGIDLCHIHSIFDSNRYNGLIDVFKELGIPVIYFYHSNIDEDVKASGKKDSLNKEKIIAQNELLKKSDRIICFNEHHRRIMINKNHNFGDKIYVLYHGTVKRQIKKISGKHKIILYVGRFSKEKGIFDLVKAYKKISSKKTKLILVGGSEDKRSIKKIRYIINKKNYQIIDWIDDEKALSCYYQKANLVVLPSHYDSFNMVGIEALAHGKKILVSDIPVFEEVYINKGLADRFKCKNVLDLAKNMNNCIKKQSKKVKLPEEYSLESFIKRLEIVNQSVL